MNAFIFESVLLASTRIHDTIYDKRKLSIIYKERLIAILISDFFNVIIFEKKKKNNEFQNKKNRYIYI